MTITSRSFSLYALLILASLHWAAPGAQAASNTITIHGEYTSSELDAYIKSPQGELIRTKTYDRKGRLKKDRLKVTAETTLSNIHMTADQAKHAVVEARFWYLFINAQGEVDEDIAARCRFKVKKVNKRKGTASFLLDISINSKGKVSNKAGSCDVDWDTPGVQSGLPFFGTIFSGMGLRINEEIFGSAIVYGQDYNVVFPPNDYE